MGSFQTLTDNSTGQKGALHLNSRSPIVDMTVEHSDCVVLIDATSNDVTVSLPASPVQGSVYIIKAIHADHTCTVDGNGHDIDGASTVELAQDESITVIFFAISWYVL